jgi:PPP family 3-phenylpropionic acid transporter
MAVFAGSALPYFLALFAALYAAFGAQSPFLPTLLKEHGLEAEMIGLVLAASTAVRFAAGPAAGRAADRLDAPRAVFAGCAAAAALAALFYLPAHGMWPLLAVGVAQAAALAPLAPLADSLALGAAAGGAARGFEYGWVRGAGSAAFILGTVVAGQAVSGFGIGAIVWLNAALLVAAAVCVTRVPRLLPKTGRHAQGEAAVAAAAAEDRTGGVAALLRLPLFRRLMLAAALILGSHALHDGFAVIRWRAAGIEPGAVGLLWSESVAAEVLVFLVLGRPLLDRLGPAGATVLAAAAGALRWVVMAQTAWLPAVALMQPLHGLTFALQHLAAMRLLALIVPPHLAATALTLYGTVAIGAATALLTLASGALYGRFGAAAFWAMAALCAAAAPVAWGLRPPPEER